MSSITELSDDALDGCAIFGRKAHPQPKPTLLAAPARDRLSQHIEVDREVLVIERWQIAVQDHHLVDVGEPAEVGDHYDES